MTLATFSTTLVAKPRVSGFAVLGLVIVPTIMASKNKAWPVSHCEPGPMKANALNTTSEIALVGPLIRCEDEPKIEATIVTTMAGGPPPAPNPPTRDDPY